MLSEVFFYLMRSRCLDRVVRRVASSFPPFSSQDMLAAKRAKHLEKERAAEARERQHMAEEEWYQERVKWTKIWGGRDGSWRTVSPHPRPNSIPCCTLPLFFRHRSVSLFPRLSQTCTVSAGMLEFPKEKRNITIVCSFAPGERDQLTRSVFPALNNMCKTRRVRVLPVDLRWGLTSEDTSDTGLGALEHCLLEIDHSRPFFVVLAGDRYGWIPPNYRVSDRPEFDWVKTFEDGHSITAMGTTVSWSCTTTCFTPPPHFVCAPVEIQYGFVRNYNRPVHAFLYRRDPAFLAEIPEGAPERKIFSFDYTDVSSRVVMWGPQVDPYLSTFTPLNIPLQPVVLARREKLREDMEQHPYCSTRTYACKYGGLDDEGKPHVTGLAAFEQVL